MSNEKHSKHFFNLTVLEENHVKDFAWAAVGQLTMVKDYHKVIDWVSRIKQDWHLSDECWEACMCAFWTIVSVFANPHNNMEYIEVGKGFMLHPLRIYLPKEGE